MIGTSSGSDVSSDVDEHCSWQTMSAGAHLVPSTSRLVLADGGSRWWDQVRWLRPTVNYTVEPISDTAATAMKIVGIDRPLLSRLRQKIGFVAQKYSSFVVEMRDIGRTKLRPVRRFRHMTITKKQANAKYHVTCDHHRRRQFAFAWIFRILLL